MTVDIFCYLLMGIGAVYASMLVFVLYVSLKYKLPVLGMQAPKNEPPYHAPPAIGDRDERMAAD